MLTADRVHIEQLEVFGRVGVTEDERSRPQRLVLNLTAWPRDSFDSLGDNIERAVDYSRLALVTREFIEKRTAALVETLVTELATVCLEKFPIRKIDIELRKFVLRDAQYVSVALSREAAR